MPATKEPKPTAERGILRKRGIIGLSALAVSGMLYVAFFFDDNLTHFLEVYGAQLNGAQVNIARVRTHFLKSSIEFEGIQIAHNARPMHNLLQIDHITIDYLTAPLFAKKLIITNIEIEGIRHNSPREHSGLIPVDDRVLPSYGVLDRTSPTLYPNLPENFAYSENPLARLARFSMGFDVQTKFDAARDHLRALREMDEVRQQLDAQVEAWQTLSETLPSTSWFADQRSRIAQLMTASGRSPASANDGQAIAQLKGEIEGVRGKAEKSFAQLRIGSDQLNARIGQMGKLVEADTKLLRNTLGLPSLKDSDLTGMIFGPRVTNYLERLSYWIDLTRRRMPKGSRTGQILLMPTDSGSTDVHFGKMSTYPAAIILKGTIRSGLAKDPYGGIVDGSFDGITSDPPMYGQPAHIRVNADFPGQGIVGFHLDVTIDHSQRNSTEKLVLGAESFPLDHWAIHQSSDLAISIEHGLAELHMQGDFGEGEATADWKASVRNIDYKVTTPYPQLRETLEGIFNTMPNIDVIGQLSSHQGQDQLHLESNLGRELALGIQSQFRHPMEAIDDSLRKFILDEIDQPREQLQNKLTEFRHRWEQAYSKSTKSFEGLLAAADDAHRRWESLDQTASRK